MVMNLFRGKENPPDDLPSDSKVYTMMAQLVSGHVSAVQKLPIHIVVRGEEIRFYNNAWEPLWRGNNKRFYYQNRPTFMTENLFDEFKVKKEYLEIDVSFVRNTNRYKLCWK